MEKIRVKVTDAPIVSVEKGSIYSKPGAPVIAFTVDQDGVPVKAIVKGNLAKTIWDSFLKDGKTKDKTTITNIATINCQTVVSFVGDIKDFRKEGLVLDNLDNVVFSYHATIA